MSTIDSYSHNWFAQEIIGGINIFIVSCLWAAQCNKLAYISLKQNEVPYLASGAASF